MHKTRKSSTTRLPIARKGTKYIARASSHVDSSVPVVIAVRDMLNLAKTAKEVKEMIKQKMLKINGRVVKDYRESILLFNLFEAGKTYELSILPTKKFAFKEVKGKDRLCKVVGKRLVSSGAVQIALHDGTNLITKEKINTGDTVYLDPANKIKKHISIDKAKDVFIFSGKYAGNEAKVESIKDKLFKIKLNGETSELNSDVLAAI